jgi:hypothetical protein
MPLVGPEKPDGSNIEWDTSALNAAEENIWTEEGWRKLHDKELHNLYSLPSIIRMIKWGCSTNGVEEECM